MNQRPTRLASILFALVLIPTTAFAGPGMIQYQGRLTNPSGTPITAATPITFTFWSAATGGTQLGGTYYDTDTVTPNSQGIYTTMIGDETGMKIPEAIFNNPQVWLNVRIGTENLSPRKQMVAVPYALQSNTATTATTAIASRDTLASITGRGASTANQMTLSGGLKVGTISPLVSSSYVDVDGVNMMDGAIRLPALPAPSSPAGKLYSVAGTLTWNGTPVMLMKGESYIVVQTTSNAKTNGANLISAYNYAKTLRPHGADLATSNRLTVLIPPGRYDLTSVTLNLNANHVDIVGMSSQPADQFITANLRDNESMIRHTAENVRIENLFLEASCSVSVSNPPAAYHPDPDTTQSQIRNCEFSGKGSARSMFSYVVYPARYERCKAGDYSFGAFGAVTGTFIDCEAGEYSFGFFAPADGTFIRCRSKKHSFGSNTRAGGTFIDCIGGDDCFGMAAVASGVFRNCAAGDRSFGRNGTASGSFINCQSGNSSFGYYGTASGTFIGCVSGWSSFGTYGVANGTFTNCTGGDFCFGGYGAASGKFTNCKAGDYSFGCGSESVVGTASGTFVNCTAGMYSFAAGGLSFPGYAVSILSGSFDHCIAGTNSFGGMNATSVGARLKDCSMNGTAWSGNWSGRMENCRWSYGIKCDAPARIYNSTFVGTLNLNNTAAGATQSRAKSIINDASNVFGATNGDALNTENANVQ